MVGVGGNLRSPPVPVLESVLLVRIVAHSPVSSESNVTSLAEVEAGVKGKVCAPKGLGHAARGSAESFDELT